MPHATVALVSVRAAKLRKLLVPIFWTLAMFLVGCRGVGTDANSPPPPPPSGDITQIKHIIILAQENRGFEHYFGAMRQYWADNGFPDRSFDGLPQFNPASGTAPLQGPVPTNPGCDPAFPAPGNDCKISANSPQVESFHMVSMCEENPSPSWNESHVDWNLKDPLSPTATLDGFVWTAVNEGGENVYLDSDGRGAMSFYDGNVLPYYYFRP